MGGFFKPWRRKIGIATLVMACVLMAACVRSYLVRDVISLRIDWINQSYLITYESGIFSWTWYRNGGQYALSNNWTIRLPIGGEAAKRIWSRDLLPRLVPTSLSSERSYRDAIHGYRVTCAYVIVAIPSAMLSAFLLLYKPRRFTSRIGRDAPIKNRV